MELHRFTNKKMPLGAAATDHLHALIAGHMRHLARVFSSHQRPSKNLCGKHGGYAYLEGSHSPILTRSHCLARKTRAMASASALPLRYGGHTAGYAATDEVLDPIPEANASVPFIHHLCEAAGSSLPFT
jgi:hypothetical protein